MKTGIKLEWIKEEYIGDFLLCCPEEDIERIVSGNVRNKLHGQPVDYLNHWLKICRPFAYATRDDSWGELEKMLSIIMRNYVKAARDGVFNDDEEDACDS